MLRTDQADAPERAVGRVLRRGIMMPDWSAVTSEAAGRALEAVFAIAGRDEKWSGLGDEEDRVWRAVLEGFGATGRAPHASEIAAATGSGPQLVAAALARLRARDLVVLAQDASEVTAAYPFCDWATGHRVHWNGVSANALCAIDALGLGAMLGRDTVIETSCRHCGAPIRIATRADGTKIASSSPEQAVVWCGIAYAGNCGATSGCTLKVFFCSGEHLRLWRDAGRATTPGFRLSVDEAHQVGRAMFAPMLRPSVSAPAP
jgi:mercuric reductase